MKRLITLDTETTGIDPLKGHRVIEIGAVDIIDRQITSSTYQQYIQPEKNVGKSVEIHGITDKFLINKPKFKKIVNEFLAYIKGATLIIHNAPFDLGFLNNELKIIGINKRIEDNCSIIDTMELSKKQRPGMLHSLDVLCRKFGIDTTLRVKHGALLDAQILAKVYLAMTGGQFDLFNNTDQEKTTANKQHIIQKVSANRNKIKIIHADKSETLAHNTYFNNL